MRYEAGQIFYAYLNTNLLITIKNTGISYEYRDELLLMLSVKR